MTVASVAFPVISRQRPETSPIRSEIQHVALRAFTELAIAFALGAICLPFISSGAAAMTIVTYSLACVGVDTILTIFSRIFQQTIVRACLERISALIFSISTKPVRILFHESGHYCAAKLLFKGAPHIRLVPFKGGCTSYSTRWLTSCGRSLGFRRSVFAITLAGIALDLLVATVAMAVGLLWSRSHPNASAYLTGAALVGFYWLADYAYTAITPESNDLGHDFIRLKTFGLPPATALAAIVSIPIILILGMTRPKLIKASS